MTLEEFRLIHSELIENYQFIEFHLEGLYGLICEDGFFNGIDEVEKYSLTRLISEFETLDKEREKPLLSEQIYSRLYELCDRRNVWVHECYTSMCFDPKTGGLKKEADRQALLKDFRESKELRSLLYKRIEQNLKADKVFGPKK